MDALSETLRVVRLTGAIFISARFSAPWCYASPAAETAAPLLEPGAENGGDLPPDHRRRVLGELDGLPPRRLVAGDIVVFPRGDAHRMSSTPGVPPGQGRRLTDVLARRPRMVAYGGGGASTRIVCGYMACDARLARMLLAGLPRCWSSTCAIRRRAPGWRARWAMPLREARSPRPGGAGVLAKLAEVLFIEVMRLYMAEDAEGRTGWLAGVRDRVVGAALAALHKDPARPWTLDELARTAGASRSVLAERFQQLVGASPMQHLAQWRMLLAANLLRAGRRAAEPDRRDRRLPDRHRLHPSLPPRIWRSARHMASQPACPQRGPVIWPGFGRRLLACPLPGGSPAPIGHSTSRRRAWPTSSSPTLARPPERRRVSLRRCAGWASQSGATTSFHRTATTPTPSRNGFEAQSRRGPLVSRSRQIAMGSR